MEATKKITNLKDVAASRKDYPLIDPRIIEEKDGFNVRHDYGDIESLAQSIKENGVKVPLTVCLEDGHVYVRSGHRRLRAVKLLIERGEDIKTVPCLHEGRHCTPEQSLFDLIVCNDGKPLLPIEEGFVYLKLLNHGYNQTEISKKVARSTAQVSNCILYATAPKTIQNLLTDGTLRHSNALKVLRLEKTDSEKVEICEKLIKAVAGNGSGEVVNKDETTETSDKTTKATKDKTKTKDVTTNESVVENNTENTTENPVRSQTQALENILPSDKQTPNTRMKNLKIWVSENADHYEDDPKFNFLQKTLDYIAGKITIEDLTKFI